MTTKNEFIHTLKLRNLYPFYIKKPNSIFFESDLRQYQNKTLYKGLFSSLEQKIENDVSDESLNEMIEIQTVNSHHTLAKVINHSVKKIALILGSKNSVVFKEIKRDELNEPIYVAKKEEISDLKILGHNLAQKRYTYGIDIDPNSYLSDFVEQIQISYYLDKQNKMISGSFALNWGNNAKKNATFNEITRKIFENFMCRFFFENEVKKNSIFNILQLFEDLKVKIKNNKLSLESKLKSNWNNYIQRKYIDTSGTPISSPIEQDNLFNSLFISQIIILIIYEDLKSYFKSKDPSLFLSLLDDQLKIKNLRQTVDSNQDFINLLKFIKTKYVYFTEINVEDIETADDAIEAITNVANYDEDHSLWTSIPSYEIIRQTETPFFDDSDDFFQSNRHFHLLFLMMMYPQLFGLELTNSNFSTYQEVLNLFENIDTSDVQIDADIKNKADKLLCERNYDYLTFINSSLSFLIVKNYNPVTINNEQNQIISKYELDPNLKLVNNYIWAIIFSQIRMWRLYEIQFLSKKYREVAPAKLRTYIHELNLLKYDDNDHFFGLREIKKIIDKIDTGIAFKSSAEYFLRKLNSDDQRYGKSKERKYLAVGVLVAAIFGILDFFTTVFTILTVQKDLINASIQDPRNVAIVVVGTLLIFTLLALLTYGILSRMIERRQIKKIEGRKDV